MKDSQRHREFQRTFAGLRQRIANAKARSLAILIDTYAIRDRVTRARALRHGLPWSPEPFENFVKDRSKRIH
jgi:hypothetical protein